MSIPAGAVMAAAKAYCDRGETDLQDWTAEAKAELLDDIRAALEAAAPYMLAAELAAEYRRGYRDGLTDRQQVTTVPREWEPGDPIE